ncbi:ataxin-7-like protein 2b isoform X1 [Esox lucius]|uniref:SCA7 domain-containing protein n=3 Tax=Esox lucius TaxID=8010 RepID=A0A3P8YJ46_ESOLU|nr:ataxin-7-like protein 2b isoform X1 [Esox lucius]
MTFWVRRGNEFNDAGVSIREHARSAMAALDRRNPILDDFVGLNWSSWIDRVNIQTSEGTDVEECCKKTKKGVHDTMTLGKDDMFTYGHCPAHDDFFLVVCNHCGQVVKPQAFEKHCERRHGPVSKFCGRRSPPPDPKWRSRQSGPVSHKAVPEETRESGWVSLPPVERPSQEAPLSPPHPSGPQPRVPPWPTGHLPRGGPSISSSSEKPPLQKTVAGTGLLKEETSESQDPRGPRKYKKIYKKECDLNKHCGVLDPGKKKRCTRQLMCNIHSIHQRRQVVGRNKTFDQLVTDLRTGGPAGSKQPKDPSCPPGSRDPPPTAPKAASAPTEPPVDQPGARQPLCSADLRSREASETGPEEPVDMDHVLGDQRLQKASYPSSQGLPSSGEESGGEEEQKMEEDEGDEGWDLPASSWHPKPLGLCTFGSRTLSCSVFTFDRRLHRLRFAVRAMVEQQTGARLWTKIPQVTSGLQSPQATSTHPRGTGRLTGRVGGLAAATRTPSSLRSPSLPLQATGRENWSSSSPASISSGPTSSGQSEASKSGSHKPSVTKPLANQPAIKPQPSGPPRTVPDRPRKAVGRPSKARLQELELSCFSVKEKSPRDNSRKHPQPTLQEGGWTQPQGSPGSIYSSSSPKSAHSSQGPINGALSLLGKKPCPLQTHPAEPQVSHWALPGSGSTGLGKCPLLPVPPLGRPQPSTRGRGRPSSVHRGPGVFDQRDLAGAKRRKTSSGSCPSVPPFPLRGWKHRGQPCNTN